MFALARRPRAPAPAFLGRTELDLHWEQRLGDYVVSLEVSPRGGYCLVGLGDGELVKLGVDQGAVERRLHAHRGGLLGARISHDGTHWASAGQMGPAKLWSANGALSAELKSGTKAAVERVLWAPNHATVAGAAGRMALLWSAAGALVQQAGPFEGSVTALAWRPDGKALAVGCLGGVHLLFSGRSSTRHLPWSGRSVQHIAWNGDGDLLVCSDRDSVHFWRLRSGDAAHMSYPDRPRELAFDSGGTWLAVAAGSTPTLWNFTGDGPEGKSARALAGHEATCTALRFAPRAKGRRGTPRWLATGGADGAVYVWLPEHTASPVRFSFLGASVTELAWCRQTGLLLGGDADGNVCCGDPAAVPAAPMPLDH